MSQKKVGFFLNAALAVTLALFFLAPLQSFAQNITYDTKNFVTKWAGKEEQDIIFPLNVENAKWRFYKVGTSAPSTWQGPRTFQIGDKADALTHLKLTPTEDGTYVLEIQGDITRIALGLNGKPFGSAASLLEIVQWGTASNFTYFHSAFAGCKNLTINTATIDRPNVATCKVFSYAFRECKKLVDISPDDASKAWQMTSVTSLSGTFEHCEAFKGTSLKHWRPVKVRTFSALFSHCTVFDADLSGWNVSNGDVFEVMFYKCRQFKGIGLKDWNVSRGRHFHAMFAYCTVLHFIPNMSTWNLSNARAVTNMFQGCEKFGKIEEAGDQELDLTVWGKQLKHIKNFSEMFRGCHNFRGKGLAKWLAKENGSKAEKLYGMFSGCKEVVEDLSAWKVDSVKNMRALFEDCKAFKGTGLNEWKVDKVTDMAYMFKECTAFTEDLKDWKVGKVTDFSFMFYNNAKIATDFTHWDVSAGQNFSSMFTSCTEFTGETLKHWNVSNGVNFDKMFSNARKLNVDLGGWRLRNAVTSRQMFANCVEFNKDLKDWYVENIVNTEGMFLGCGKFNGDISGWRFKNLQDMSRMFQWAVSFNRDLGKWNVSNVRHMDSTFAYAKAFKGKGLDKWNVGECQTFNATFKKAEAFDGDLSNWDLHSAEQLAYMFEKGKVGKTDFSNWNVKNVTTMQGMFKEAVGDIEDVSEWNTENCENMKDIFYKAKGMRHPLGKWNFSKLAPNSEVTLEECGMGLSAWDETLLQWHKNSAFKDKEDITVNATKLVYSTAKEAHEKLIVPSNLNIEGDSYLDKDLALVLVERDAQGQVKSKTVTYKLRLKVGEKKELEARLKNETLDKHSWSVVPDNQALAETEPEHNQEPRLIRYLKKGNDDKVVEVEGLRPGKAKLKLKAALANDESLLRTFCDVYVYKPIESIGFKQNRYTLAVGDVLDLRKELIINPEDATYLDSVEFVVEQTQHEFAEVLKNKYSGLVKGLKAAEKVKVTVTTTDREKSDKTKVTTTIEIDVVDVPVNSIKIVPQSILLGKNAANKVKVRVYFDPANATDKKVNFTFEGNDNPKLVDIDTTTGATLTAKSHIGVCTLVATTSNGKEAKAKIRVVESYVPVKDINLLVRKIDLPLGTKKQLAVEVTPPLASNKGLIFTSLDEEIVTVDESGFVFGKQVGEAKVRIESVENRAAFDEATINVYSNPVTEIDLITEAEIKIGKGEKYRIKYKIVPEDASDKTITCSSENETIVSVDPTTGEITGVEEGGPVNIRIKANGATGDLEKIVKVTCVAAKATTGLTLTPSNLTLWPGDERDLQLTFVPEDATDRDIDWSSSLVEVVTVEHGHLVAKSAGESVITASLHSNPTIKVYCKVVVRAHIGAESIEIYPKELKLGIGNEYKLDVFPTPANATKYEVIWKLEEGEDYVTFDPETQIVKGNVVGVAKISAALKANPNDKSICTVNVVTPAVPVNTLRFNPDVVEIEYGEPMNLYPNLVFEPDNANDLWIDWESANPDVVSVRSGIVFGNAATTEGVLITASLHSDKSKKAACRVKVKEPKTPKRIEMITANLRIKKGESRDLTVNSYPETATDRKLKWKSSNTGIATVDQQGRVQALEKGFTMITATHVSDPEVTTFCTVEVVDEMTALIESIAIEDVEVTEGKTIDLNITFRPGSIFDRELVYKGIELNKFGISEGKIIGIAPTDQDVEVMAYLRKDPQVKTTFKVKVLPKVVVTSFTLNHENLVIYEHNQARILIQTEPAGGDTSGAVWETENSEICTVEDGVVSAIKVGKTRVNVTLNGKTVGCNVEVRAVGTIDETAVVDALWADVRVYPNPFTSELFVANLQDATQIRILNAQGLVLRSLPSQGLRDIRIAVDTLPQGLYLLVLEKEGTALRKTFRLVK